MKKLILACVVMIFALSTVPHATNAQIEDGTYSLNYQVNKAGDISASIANDYFAKPAKLIVENGKMRVQLTVKQSAWITEFTGPHGGNKKISEDPAANTRVVEFAITGINSPTVMRMKVDIDDMNYHHVYSSDFVWDASSLKLLEAAKKVERVKEEPKEEVKKEEPKKEEVKVEAAATKLATASVAITPNKTVEKEAEPKAEVKSVEEIKTTAVKPVEEKKENTEALKVVAEEKEEVPNEKTTAAEQREELATVKAEEVKEDPTETAILTEEAETAAAPVETTKSSSNAWLYIVIAFVLLGASVGLIRKRSMNKA